MLNHINLMGRLVRDPEKRSTQSGKSVATFTLAVDRDYQMDAVDFITCVAWGKQADFVGSYFSKGQLVAVGGSLQSRKYQSKDGRDVTAWEVQCQNVYFAESKRKTADDPVALMKELEPITDDEDLPF